MPIITSIVANRRMAGRAIRQQTSWLMLATMLMVGCTASNPPTTATPAITPAGQSVPADAPGATASESAGKTTLRANVVFPAGTLVLMQAGLRTRAVVDAHDLSPADLAKLTVMIDGQAVPPERVSFADLQWDRAGGIRATMTIDGQRPPVGATITIALPSRRLVLMGFAADVPSTEISLLTTARVLLHVATATPGQGPEAIPDDAIRIVAERLGSAMTATTAGDPLTAPQVVAAVNALVKAMAEGVPRSVWPALLVMQSGSTGGGGPTGASVKLDVTLQDGQYTGTITGGSGH